MKRSAAAILAVAGLFVIAGCATAVPQEAPAPAEQPESAAQAPAVEVPPLQLSSEPRVGPGNPALQEQIVTVAPTQLIVPSLGIDMGVVPEGVDDDGYMSIPEDVRTVGWYEFGAGPASESGSTVLAAHVDDPVQGVGPFSRLRDTEVGAEATVIDANGVAHVYRVTSVERISKAEVPLDRVFTLQGAPHLVLVTCGGAFDRAARSYTDNYIVTAEKVS